MDFKSSLETESTLSLLKNVITGNVRRLPNYLKHNIYWIAALAILWLPLMTIPTFKVPSALTFLWSLLIFLTAAYNNFIAKVLYISIISNIILPFIRLIRGNRHHSIMPRLKKVKDIIKASFIELGGTGIVLTIGAAGVGLFISNYLTRNNKIDKYLICILSATAIMKSLSDGRGNLLIKLGLAFIRDLRIHLLKNRSGKANSYKVIYVAYSSFSFGLILNIIANKLFSPFSNIINKFGGAYDKLSQGGYYDPSAYFLGVLFILIAIILKIYFTKKKGKGLQ